MKKTTKVLSLLVTVILLIGVVSVVAFAETNTEVTVTWKDGEATLATSNVAVGEVPLIPDTIKDYDETKGILLGFTTKDGGSEVEKLTAINTDTTYYAVWGKGNFKVEQGDKVFAKDIPETEFKTYIEGLKVPTTITLYAENFNSGATNNVMLNTNVTFDLNGKTFTQSTQFVATNREFIIKNGNFNSKSSNMVFLWTPGGFLRVENCTLTLDGAIVESRNTTEGRGRIEVEDCIINNNVAKIFYLRQGIYDINLKNSTIKGNAPADIFKFANPRKADIVMDGVKVETQLNSVLNFMDGNSITDYVTAKITGKSLIKNKDNAYIIHNGNSKVKLIAEDASFAGMPKDARDKFVIEEQWMLSKTGTGEYPIEIVKKALEVKENNGTITDYAFEEDKDLSAYIKGNSTITLYHDYSINTDTKVWNVKFNLNGHTLTSNAYLINSYKITFENGKIIQPEGAEIAITPGWAGSNAQGLVFNNVDVDCISLCNTEIGYLQINNSNINVRGSEAIVALQNGTSNKIDIQNTTFTFNNEESAMVNINDVASRSAFSIDLQLNNVTVNGKISSILRNKEEEANKVTSATVNIDGNCKFDVVSEIVNAKVTAEKTTVTIATGAKFGSNPIGSSANYVLKDVDSKLVPVNDGYRVLPKLTDGQVYVNIDSDVNLVYVLPFAEGQKPVATFTLETANGNIVQKVNGVPLGGNKFAFKFENIDPRYFGDTILIVVEPAPAANISASTITVKDYLLKAVELNSADNELKVLAHDILRYGAAAQTYKNYKTNALVTNGVDLANGSNVTLDKSLLNFKGTNAETKISSIAVRLEGEVNMLVKIKANDITGLNLVVTVNGRKITIPVTAENKQADNTYVVAFPVNAYEFGDAISLTLKNASSELGTVTYSVNSYIFERLGTIAEPEKALLKSMANYGASAKAYATKA